MKLSKQEAATIAAPKTKRKRPAGSGMRIVSRYHVAKLMEMRYGLGWSYRRIGNYTGLSFAGVVQAIKRAEAGAWFPEVTPHYIRVEVEV